MKRTHARARARRYARAAAAFLMLGATTLATGPASATHEASTATVNLKAAPAGAESVSFGLTVGHPAGAGPAITTVRITPPQELLDDGTLFWAVGGFGPSGWTAVVGGTPRSVTFSVESGQGLVPGQNGMFTVHADVGRPSTDMCGTWDVAVSNGGELQDANPAAGGALESCVRVLEVQELAIVAPDGATDNSVTAGQSGVCARMRVANHGSSDLPVVPQIEGSQTTVGLARAAGEPPCSGDQLPEGTAVVESETAKDVDFRLTFGDAQTTMLAGRGAGPGSTAIDRSLIVTIQPRATLLYLAGSLFPRSVKPGTEGAAFRLTVTKGPAGSPAATLDPAATTLAFAGCPTRSLTSDPALPAGQATAELAYESCDVAEIADGRYDVTAPFTYTDANDFTRTATIGDVSSVRIDGTPPSVQVSLEIPAPACCVPPAAPAVKNGDTVRLTGNVRDADPVTGQLEPCPECFVQAQIQRFTDAGCGAPGLPPITVSVSNGGGNLSAIFTAGYGEGTRSMRWHVTAGDEASNSATGQTGCTVVDNVKPRIQKAQIERVGGEDRIRVTLDECIGGQTQITDWRLTANAVSEVLPLQCNVVEGTPHGVVVLRALLPSPDEKPPGIVEYAPLPAPVGGRLFDRADNTMDPQDAEIDGPPLLKLGQK